MEEVKLKVVKEQEVEELNKKKKEMRMEVGRARSRDELMRIARERGYSVAWVHIQMRLKGICS